MSYDPVAQAAVLRREVDRLDVVSGQLDLPAEQRKLWQESKATFRQIADMVEQGTVTDPAECQRVLYNSLTAVRECREDFEMVAERLGR